MSISSGRFLLMSLALNHLYGVEKKGVSNNNKKQLVVG